MAGKPVPALEEYAAEYPYQPRTKADVEVVPSVDVDLPATHWTRRVNALALVLFAIFCVSDWALIPLTWVFDQNDWGAVWVYLSAGTILAQAGLLAAVFVFASGEFWRRFALCWAVAGYVWTVCALGFVTRIYLAGQTIDASSISGLRSGALALPLFGLAIQAPLWLFRLYRGWQFVDEAGPDWTGRPLSIRDYMIGMGIVALSLTSARLAISHQSDNEYWAGWSVLFACAAGISLASVIPAVLLMFRFRDWRVGLVILVVYGTVAAAVVMALIEAGTRWLQAGPSGLDWWSAIGLMLLFASFGGFLGLGLKAVRDMGFSLVMGREKK
jgi:hypothetical protein